MIQLIIPLIAISQHWVSDLSLFTATILKILLSSSVLGKCLMISLGLELCTPEMPMLKP